MISAMKKMQWTVRGDRMDGKAIRWSRKTFLRR